MSEDQMAKIAEALGALSDSDPRDRAEIYARLGAAPAREVGASQRGWPCTR